jgi:hypothetical protein
MSCARVVIVLHLYLLEQCLDPVFRTSIKTRNLVIFYEFLIHVGMHHTTKPLQGMAFQNESPINELSY